MHKPVTALEKEFIRVYQRCPDCEIGGFRAGPEGGCAINVKCSHCGSAFNMTMFGPTGIERIYPGHDMFSKDPMESDPPTKWERFKFAVFHGRAWNARRLHQARKALLA